jgi:hypothetical protein
VEAARYRSIHVAATVRHPVVRVRITCPRRRTEQRIVACRAAVAVLLVVPVRAAIPCGSAVVCFVLAGSRAAAGAGAGAGAAALFDIDDDDAFPSLCSEPAAADTWLRFSCEAAGLRRDVGSALLPAELFRLSVLADPLPAAFVASSLAIVARSVRLGIRSSARACPPHTHLDLAAIWPLMHASQKLPKQHLEATTASAITVLQILQWSSGGTPSSGLEDAGDGVGRLALHDAFGKSYLGSPLVGQCWIKCPGTLHLWHTYPAGGAGGLPPPSSAPRLLQRRPRCWSSHLSCAASITALMALSSSSSAAESDNAPSRVGALGGGCWEANVMASAGGPATRRTSTVELRGTSAPSSVYSSPVVES